MRRAIDNLYDAGCRRVYLNGSFVTSKPAPNDFDACWETEDVDFSKVSPIGIENDWQYENTKKIVARFAARLDETTAWPLPADENRRMAQELGRAGARGIMHTLQDQMRYYVARRGAYLGNPGVPETMSHRTPTA